LYLKETGRHRCRFVGGHSSAEEVHALFYQRLLDAMKYLVVGALQLQEFYVG
jgi:hypothetical protein